MASTGRCADYHRRPTVNDILPRLADIKHYTPIDADSSYHNLKLDKKSSYLPISSNLFVDSGILDCNLGQTQLLTCFTERWMTYSRICQINLV